MKVSPGPAIFLKYQYRVSRVRTAMGAQMNVQERMANRLPAKSPMSKSLAVTP